MFKKSKLIYSGTGLITAIAIGLVFTSSLSQAPVEASTAEKVAVDNYTIAHAKAAFRVYSESMPVTAESIDDYFSVYPEDRRILAVPEDGVCGFTSSEDNEGSFEVEKGKTLTYSGPDAASVKEVKEALKAEFVK